MFLGMLKVYTKKKNALKSTFTNLLDIKSVDSVKLDPDFINHILFHSSSKYASLASNDRCSFYDLILAGHIKDSSGELKHLIVQYETRKGVTKTALTTKTTFLQNIAFKRCPGSKNFEKYFNLKNSKETFKKIFLKTPATNEECLTIHKEFVADLKTPYICKIYEEVEKIKPLERLIKQTPRSQYKKLTKLKSSLRDAKIYKKSLNASSYDYLKNLCDNIEKPKMFCQDFFDASYWKKIGAGQKSSYPVINFCKELTKKTKLTKRDILKCSRRLNSEKNLCLYTNKYSNSLVPKPDCKQISKALNFSRLKSDFQDCPGNVGNLGLVNIARVTAHFDDSAPSKGSNCQTNTAYQFLKFNLAQNEAKYWGNQICYRDKINQKDVCEPTLFGDYEDHSSSLSLLIEKVMRRTRGFSGDQKCKVIQKEDYKPSLLQFKSGCWIILNSDKCYASSCKFKILNEEQVVKHIWLKSELIFPYFADSFTAQSITQDRFIQNFYKKKSRKILNISFLKTVFKDKPNTIIHGVGCKEDLLPTFFQKRSLNECSPLPFIVDGYFEEDGKM